MSSQTPDAKAPSQSEAAKQGNTELENLTATGKVADIVTQLSNMAKIDEADAAVAPLENEHITNKQRRNSFGAGGSIALNVAGAVLAGLSANPMTVAACVASIALTASGLSAKQQRAKQDEQLLTAEHGKAIEDSYNKAFSPEQKEDFARIMSGYKGDSDLLKNIEKMYDPKDPKPLKIKDVNDFLAKDTGRSLMLRRSVSRALNDKDPAREEYRTNLALLMTDDKARAFVMTKIVR